MMSFFFFRFYVNNNVCYVIRLGIPEVIVICLEVLLLRLLRLLDWGVGLLLRLWLDVTFFEYFYLFL